MTVLADNAPLISPAPNTKQPRYATFTSVNDQVHETKHNVPSTTPGTASFKSRIFFSFANPMMSAGNTRQLDNDDLWELDHDNQSAAAFDKFVVHYERHDKSIVKAMATTYRGSLLLSALATLFTTACNVLAPAVLNHVVTAFAAPTIDLYDLSLWLGLFFASRIANAVVLPHVHYYIELVALRLTVSLKGLLFRKAMRRSIQSKGDDKAVDISNLFSSDVDNVLWAAFVINSVWVTPIQIVVVVFMLYDVIGVAAFAGLGVIVASVVAGFVIAKVSGDTFEDVMKYKDNRMKTIKEVFNAIQIVKLNAWEDKFADKIHKLRATELSAIKKFMYLGALNIFVLWGSPLVVSAVSFAVYAIVMEQALTAAKVFTAIALFNAIRDPLRDLPTAIQTCIQAKVSINRFTDYFALDEFNPDNVTRDDPMQPEDVALAIADGSFGWTKETALLNEVNLTVKRGDLVIVHGSVGSGKSSLCSAILGEMDKLAGDVFVRGRVAYYSQDTWIQNMTIRENILFGLPYNKEKYSRVIAACGLLPDLKQFPGGDETEIGQKGVNLSGGQKARVCLARACYSDADVLLLDSPLAAVDAIVQSQIFSDCICNLLGAKTVVLVTHSADIIASKAANVKVLVEDGKLTATQHEVALPRCSFTLPVSPRSVKNDVDHDQESNNTNEKDAGRLIDDEEREEGRVSKEVFSKYFNSLGGVKVCVFLFVVQTLWQGFQIGSDLWLSRWTGQKNGSYNHDEAAYNMKVYSLLGAGAAVMVFVRSATVAVVGLRASRHLFDNMTQSLLRAPLRFFDANPIGRIVNRYGDDMANVDSMIPFAFGGFLAMFFFTVCQLVTAVSTMKFLGVLIIPLVWMYVKIANFYLAPSREVSRLWKVSSSPVLSHVSQSEEGVVVIRAFGRDTIDRMITENFLRNDVNSRCWLADTVTQQWFELRMQLLGCGVIVLVVSGLVYLRDLLSPGIVGLAFTYALSVDTGLASLVQSWSWVEIQMVSPERILEYGSIPAEGSQRPLVIEPDESWPRSSTVQFQDVVFSYKQGGKPVLKGLSFDIRNNEKIGIVGRTGAGKSSLTMALFRINELVSGRILIDGVDIATMPLRTLRSNLSIIPQSPVLFKGSLRTYMDPFDEFTDSDIWSALEKVDMKTQVSALEGQLAFELSENGDNFSVGERQMLCVARALLTRSRIVVMDEATASIDHATEKKLQEMIKRDFQDATVLTIAHRLATVLDSDRIMVLSDGRVVEFDSPRNLAKDKSGVFHELAKEGGYLDQLL
ncbi:Multidrug resistance-associated protein 1 [Phytophthora rubi]|uniref:Multidrug resistance-associated protein 1 n=2 Tax=Phytophthora rubi TaxID=129364 RepID=A0A6A3N3G9_9STRA|nr:Multidrug resistance-associated protein 1 [Phytophthora rubi]KAE9036129.1 Multidrug resistance-associated protein 1 [Phytophthora rubi]KAE9342247.1 Multidrug resistance-associated protein 1 [Phytophthora rubi]